MHKLNFQKRFSEPGAEVRPPMAVCHDASGFSLIEVLIALIVMSVGMLGIAGLYVHGMQAGRTSLFRHHAIILAGDVADRIRANPVAGPEYVDNSGTAAPPEVDCIEGGTNCTPAQMAVNDIYLWDQQAISSLPDGDVSVTYVEGEPSIYTVEVSWSEAGSDETYNIAFPVFEPAI